MSRVAIALVALVAFCIGGTVSAEEEKAEQRKKWESERSAALSEALRWEAAILTAQTEYGAIYADEQRVSVLLLAGRLELQLQGKDRNGPESVSLQVRSRLVLVRRMAVVADTETAARDLLEEAARLGQGLADLGK